MRIVECRLRTTGEAFEVSGSQTKQSVQLWHPQALFLHRKLPQRSPVRIHHDKLIADR